MIVGEFLNIWKTVEAQRKVWFCSEKSIKTNSCMLFIFNKWGWHEFWAPFFPRACLFLLVRCIQSKKEMLNYSFQIYRKQEQTFEFVRTFVSMWSEPNALSAAGPALVVTATPVWNAGPQLQLIWRHMTLFLKFKGHLYCDFCCYSNRQQPKRERERERATLWHKTTSARFTPTPQLLETPEGDSKVSNESVSTSGGFQLQTQIKLRHQNISGPNLPSPSHHIAGTDKKESAIRWCIFPFNQS